MNPSCLTNTQEHVNESSSTRLLVNSFTRQLVNLSTRLLVYSSIILLACSLFSCNDEKSLQERIQEEKRAIDRYISRNKLSILSEYPSNGVFGEKEYFKTSDGLYIHVVDSGNGQRVNLVDEVTVRFEYRHDILVSDSSIVRWDASGLVYPYSFKYGQSQTYTVYGSLVCVGWVYPLLYVGKHAVVDMIVPSSLGSSSDDTNINPVFYKGVTYTNFY